MHVRWETVAASSGGGQRPCVPFPVLNRSSTQACRGAILRLTPAVCVWVTFMLSGEQLPDIARVAPKEKSGPNTISTVHVI